jgi:DNA topoisomerase-1
MPNRLIIVESPSKARTLSKFLGAGYTVKASMGHIRDLPKSRLGVDLEGGYTPEYEVLKGKEAQIRELRAAARKAGGVLLASDPDREGEAIAWHLTEALKLKDAERIVFHEITRQAVEAALSSPRKIDRDLVAAQEARRVIDRLVGYQLSPLLWKKVRTGLSAGRVQSVAVRLVVDRENEIEAFVPEEWWTIEAALETEKGEQLTARLHARRDDTETSETSSEDGAGDEAPSGRLRIGDLAAAEEVMNRLGVDAEGRPGTGTPAFRVAAIEARETSRNAPSPYTTSTLQQDASTRLRFSPKRTMAVAQQLYEGVELGPDGSVGLITYMRTDSPRISELARSAAEQYVGDAFGKNYVRKGSRPAASKGPVQAQDAHEAVRPTDVARTPEAVADHLSADQRRLYELIWRRFVASQMAPARFENTRVDIHAGDYVFRASGSVLKFDGFTRVLRRDDDKADRSLPALSVEQLLACLGLSREQHFTQAPPRYTEASLIKELEERGIGRPSTYAPTIEVIQERNYVREEERRLHPTELGKTVDGVLREHFPEIVDVDFTAEMEKKLDGIEGGRRPYVRTVQEWYEPFAKTLQKAETSMERVRVPARETGETCPECEIGQLVVRQGRFGEFTGCARYPECKYIKGKDTTPPQPTGESCPECGKALVQRQGKRGPFVGCSGYPDCRFIQPQATAAGDGTASAARSRPAPEPTGESCPDCSKPLVRRQGRFGPFVSCSGYPRCRYRPPKAAAAAAGSAQA